jgi:predicted porin
LALAGQPSRAPTPASIRTLSDGCSSFIQNAGVNYTSQNSNADSGRCGQSFNGQLWGGISNKQYGTLTIGRQNSFELDNIGKYDPMELSYAFSLLGYSGTNGGSGSTQAARWDNSAKYVYDFGIVHAGAMYSNGGSGTGFFGNAYSFDVGAVYQGFAIDAVYTKERSVVNLQTAVNDTLGGTTLAANISDDTTWSVMAKYTFNLGRSSIASPAPYPTKAAVKAEPENDKLVLFAGYSNVSTADPRQPIFFGAAAGNYALTSTAALPDNDAFTTPRVYQFFWAGAKYEFAWGLSLTGAYYHVDQNSYVADGVACTAGGASRNQCAGTYDQVSFLVDYMLNKHLDVYSGATWAQVNNGLASSFPGTPNAKFGQAGTGTSVSTATWMSGFRIRL